MLVGRKIWIEKKVPDFFAALFSIKRFVLRVTDPAELLFRVLRLGAIALSNLLYHSGPGIDFAPEHSAQIAFLSSENILPVWLVTEELKRVRHQLTRASQFPAYSRNEDDRAHSNRLPLVTKIRAY